MLVESFRAMEGFPIDIEHKILRNNVLCTGEKVPVDRKHKTVALEVLYWMYDRKIETGPLEKYRIWMDLKKLRWKGDKYDEILSFYVVWKIIVEDLGPEEFETKIDEVEIYLRKKMEQSKDDFIKHLQVRAHGCTGRRDD